MKIYRVEFTADAREDMLDYARYIAQQEGDDRQAIDWFEGLREAITTLAEMPNRCAPARENAHSEEEIRQLNHQSHRIIFSVHDDLELVAVHRVWHASRDDLDQDGLPGLHEDR